VAEGVLASGAVVQTLVPTGFSAYARVLHPAFSEDGNPVSWARIAAWAGTRVHGLAQFAAIVRPGPKAGHEAQPWAYEPSIGKLPSSTWTVLARLLSSATATPDHCCFGVWDGWTYQGGQQLAYRAGAETVPVEEVPRMVIADREYALFVGPLAAYGDVGYLLRSGRFDALAPSLVWPQDRAWLVATDIDLDSTYVGGSAQMVSALVADSLLEAYPVRPDDPITAGSDTINR
jgi:hypothetical protein